MSQPSLDRLRRFDISPKRKLGQNFLIDNNILDVIADAAALTTDDVVLEIGGGLGVLSEYLADRVAHVHVIEIDTRLQGALEDATGGRDNVTLSFADAIDLDFAALNPRPNKLVANLPYGIAATGVIQAFQQLPELELVCVMTQREVAERLVSKPGGKLYGATSVLVQAVADQTSARKLSRNIFHPVPNVDSSLVTLSRSAPNPPASFVDLVHHAFAHRRKPLPGSLALARRGKSDAETVKARASATLITIGHDANTRAERLSPADFVALDTALREFAESDRQP
ncbi:MAG: 16S rRNA (adenine(1518)-N(6)/adenine(1519)-N(6))-dimethyltransferase RsmA [Solirubrobacterales bacterium]